MADACQNKEFCMDHSGILAKLDHGDRKMTEHSAELVGIRKMTNKIFIGVIILLLSTIFTGAVSAYIAFNKPVGNCLVASANDTLKKSHRLVKRIKIKD